MFNLIKYLKIKKTYISIVLFFGLKRRFKLNKVDNEIIMMNFKKSLS